MPELPEVECLKRGLDMYLPGHRIIDLVVNKPKLIFGKGIKRYDSTERVLKFMDGLRGEKFKNVQRIAKNLIFVFESGKVLLVHLKMTGQMVFVSSDSTVVGGHPIQESEYVLPNKHTHIIFQLDNGTLYYNDVRMFGYLLLFENWDAILDEGYFEDLGKDPLDSAFTFDYFFAEMRKYTSSLKSVLLNQKVVTGLGNIYCDEVCFAAGIRPDRLVRSLSDNELNALYKSINDILNRAIVAGGSSVANYLLVDGSKGNFAREHNVYMKAGKPCKRCGTLLSKTMINSRTTVYCINCQR